MKRIFLFSLFCLLLLLSCATGKKEEAKSSFTVVEDVDWAEKLEYNENSNSAKVEATVKSYIDGDTVHFNVPENVVRGGILKARFRWTLTTTLGGARLFQIILLPTPR